MTTPHTTRDARRARSADRGARRARVPRRASSTTGSATQRRPLEELTTLPKALRAQLADALPLAFTSLTMQTADDGTTAKWLWRAADGAQVETVLMR